VLPRRCARPWLRCCLRELIESPLDELRDLPFVSA
jgi:hypothetical protein